MSPWLLDPVAQTLSNVERLEVTAADASLMEAMPMPAVATLMVCAGGEGSMGALHHCV